MPYTVSSGIRIHYEVEGQGPTLVLQHGFTHNLRRWFLHGYVDVLRNDYELVLVDARGHGSSDKPHNSSAYTLAAHVGDVVAVLDDLNRATATFWGYSMGGRVGFGLAKHAPGRIDAFVIGGASAHERRRRAKQGGGRRGPGGRLAPIFGRASIDVAALVPR